MTPVSPYGVSKGKETKENLIKRIKADFENAKTAREPRVERWDSFYEHFCSINPDKPEDGKANLFIPEIEGHVRTIQIRLCSPFLNATEPYVTGIPREPSDNDNAKIKENLLFYQLQQTDFGRRLCEFALQALIYDGSPAKIYWEFEYVKEKKETEVFNPVTLQEETIQEEQYNVTHDGPVFEVLDIYDLYVDPEATTIKDARYVIVRKMVCEEELRDKEERGLYEDVGEVIKKGGLGDLEDPKGSRDTVTEENEYETAKNFELLEYYDNIKKRIYVLADREFLIRNDENEFPDKEIPIVWYSYKKRPKEFYGQGVVESIESHQDELNLKRNQRIDNVTRVQNPMYLIQRGTVDDPDELESRPGGIIQVNDINGLKLLEVPIIAYESQEELNLKQEMQNASGLSDYAQGRGGAPKQTRETATEVSSKMQMANTAFDFYFKEFCEFICEVARKFDAMTQAFMTDDKIIRILGDEGHRFVRVSPEEIIGDYDWFPAVDPAGNRDAVRLQQALQAYNLFAKDPDIDARKLKLQILKLLDFKNAEEYLIQQQPMMMPGQPNLPPELANLPPPLQQMVLEELQNRGGTSPPGEQGGPLINPQSLEKVPTGAMAGNLMGGNMISPQ